MSPKKEILFLVQVALPFALLGYFKHWGFFIPVTAIVLSLPFSKARPWLIRKWQDLGHFLGKIVSPVVLSVVYYIGLTPLAFVRRLFGSDELQLKRPAESTLKTVNLEMAPERFDDLW